MARNRKQALTLSEVLLALALLVFAILAVIGVFTSALSSMSKAGEITEATEVAREFLEKTKILGSSALPTDPEVFDGGAPTASLPSGFPPAPYPSQKLNGRTYTLKVRVSNVPGASTARAVVVEVLWGKNSRVQLESYL